MTAEPVKMEDEDDKIMHQFALQCFEEHCKALNDEKRKLSKEFKMASSSGYVTALLALGYIPLKEAEELFKTFETRFGRRKR